MTTTDKTRAKPERRAAEPVGKPSEPPLFVVTPAVGEPWTGEIVSVHDSELGSVLKCIVADALRDGGNPDKYTIVRCVKKGANRGLVQGADYLVLSQFVHKI